MSTGSPPELPNGFRWDRRCHLSKVHDGLFLEGETVASLIDRVDGSWFALLDTQRGMDGRQTSRLCSSFEAGRRGCELWAIRHEARLRAEVAAKIAARPMRVWASGPKE